MKSNWLRHLSINPLHRLSALALCLWLAGCDAPGVGKLRELCITESFPRIHQRVAAAGYFDGFQECFDAIRFLIDWDYQFVECREKKARYISAIAPGLYRVSKVPQSSGLCDEALLKQARRKKFLYMDFLASGRCLALEAIPAPTAQYGVFSGDSQTISLQNVFGSRIFMRYMYAKDMASGEKVVEVKSFLLAPAPALSVSSFATAVSCRDVVPELVDVPGLASVDRFIIPITPGKESNHGNNGRPVPGRTAG